MMNSYCKLFLLLVPTLVFGQHCPKFQSVIPLRPTATVSNFTYAVIAGGKYYLLAGQDVRDVMLTGSMPEGFEESRLTTVIDRYDCSAPEYYLMTIKSIRMADNTVHTYFSKLDLVNWSPVTKWTEPKPIKEHPMTANDPYIKMFTRFYPNYMIEDYIQTLFYWDVTKTIFVVTKPMVKPNLEHRYYSIETENACHQSFYFPESSESLTAAINSVVEPLDFCFFARQKSASHSLLYCVSGQTFQINLIKEQFQNGTLRTDTVGHPDKLPSIHQLKIFGDICHESKDPDYLAEQNVHRYQQVRYTNAKMPERVNQVEVARMSRVFRPTDSEANDDKLHANLHADKVLIRQGTVEIHNLNAQIN